MFFRKVEPLLRRHLEKAERENSFIYHQTVPIECPLLEVATQSTENKTIYGVAKPEKFEMKKADEVVEIIINH